MRTKLLYVIYTYNRPQILSECWRTIFENNVLRPDRVLIIDDGSIPKTKYGLFQAHLATDIPIDLYSLGKNVGYGQAAEKAFALVETYNPTYCFFIESDYLFRTNGLDTVMDIFENTEYGKQAIWCSGYSQPGYFKNPKETDNKLFSLNGIDNILNSEILYKPFEQKTKFGDVEVQFVANTCGTVYYNWKKFKEVVDENEYKNWVNKTVEKGNVKQNLNDGNMSSISSFYWNQWAIENNIDRNKYAAGFDIMPSIANHVNGGIESLNGKNMKEGQSCVSSPTWIE